MTKKFFKKAIAIIAVLSILALVFSACGNKQTEQQAETTAAATKPAETKEETKAETPTGKTVVSAWLGSWWADEIPAIQEKFASANPGYEVKIEPIPINNYLENAITAILGGSPPDALALDAIMIPTPVGQNLLTSLNDMMKRYNLTADMFAAGIYNAGVSDGVTYAIPFRTAPSVLMYNKTLFDKAGVPYPYDNMPLDEFLEICKKLTKSDGSLYAYGIAAAKSDPANVMSSFCPALWGMGGNFLTEDLSQSAMNTPESIAGVKYWVELYTKYKVVPEGCINYAITKDLVPLFFNQQIAMVQMNDSNIFKAQDYAKQGGYEVGTCIQQGTYSRGGGWSFTIPVTAKNAEGAEKFISYFITPEVLGEQKVVMPGVIEVQKKSDYWSNPTFDIYYKAESHTKTLPFHPKWTEIQNIIVMELQEALQGNVTPEQAAQTMHEKINAVIAK